MIKKVAVLGAGAIGGITGALLYEKGVDVVLIHHNEEFVSIVREKGLHIDGLEQDRYIKVPVVKKPDANSIWSSWR